MLEANIQILSDLQRLWLPKIVLFNKKKKFWQTKLAKLYVWLLGHHSWLLNTKFSCPILSTDTRLPKSFISRLNKLPMYHPNPTLSTCKNPKRFTGFGLIWCSSSLIHHGDKCSQGSKSRAISMFRSLTWTILFQYHANISIHDDGNELEQKERDES